MASDGARRAAASVWVRRHRVELEAAARFDGLRRRLAASGGRPEIVELAAEASDDERRHAELCERLVGHFGGRVPEHGVVEAASPGRRGLTQREGLLLELVAMSCVTETLSTALLGELCERSTDPIAAEAMRSILRDEVRHSQLGWAHLAAEHEAGTRDVVAARLPAMLAQTVRDELFGAAPEHPLQHELDGLGSLGRAVRRDIFERTMLEVVFPGLDRFGVDTGAGRAWLHAAVG